MFCDLHCTEILLIGFGQKLGTGYLACSIRKCRLEVFHFTKNKKTSGCGLQPAR
jgi:hypothetical protein